MNRSCKDDYPNNNDRILLPHLTRINLPDGSYFSMQDARGPRYVNVCEDNIEDVPGILRGIQLPTGGQIEYEFQEYDFPPGGQENTFDSSAGVKKRHLKKSDGTLVGTWTYKTTMVPQSGSTDPEMQTQVVYPTGDCSKHYFAGQYWLNVTGPDPYSGWEYGMPFVWRQSSGGRYLSSEVYSGSTGMNCSGTKLRSTYLRFDHDKLPGSAGEEDKHRWFASNRRVSATRTVFHDDGERFVDVAMSAFDGVGHYRDTVTSGNLGAALPGPGASETRTAHTEFNPARGIYAYDPTTNGPCCGHNFVPVPTTADWLQQTFTYTQISEPSATGQTVARTEFDFDANGRVRNTRVLATGTARSANDLLTAFTLDAEGNVQRIRLYGGDVQALSTGLGWTLPITYVYRTDFTYQYGALRTALDYQPGGVAMPWLAYDADIDRSTGGVLTARSPAGFSTSYNYDTLGRLLSVVPQQGAVTSYNYTVPGPGVPGAVRTTVGNFTTTFSQVETVFDEFGRPWKGRRSTPNHGWVEQETLYNARDWVLSSSALGFPANKTQYLEFDAFGRPQRVRPPDGASHDLLFAYTGSRRVVSQAKVATSQTLEQYVSREQFVDSFGRLVKVMEPSAPGGVMTPTSYKYDASGRLTEIFADNPGSVYDQTRRFTYDNRGFLLSEQHPEKGVGGNGWVTYSGFDPKGNVGRVVDGPNTLDYVHDGIGRTLRVEDVNHADRAVSEYQYDAGTGYGEAKLWKAIRHNYVDLPWTPAGEEDVTVTETYSYSGMAGLTSERLTQIAPMGYSFLQTFGYDLAGQLTSLAYPDCQHAACPPSEPARTVNYTYNLGFLTAVPGWASSITYHPNGLWNQVTRGNGVIDQQDRDLFGVARPNRIKTIGVVGGPQFDTGTYGYDGSGNVKAIGAERFVYDSVSRVKEGTAEGQTQKYDYDTFGNINSVTTVFEDLSQESYTTPTDPTTNRLQTATYDGAGSMTGWTSYAHTYEATGQTKTSTYPGGQKVFLYTADGERIWTIDNAGSLSESVTLRSLGGKVLRRYSVTGRTGTEAWSWEQDYIYRGGALLAADLPAGAQRNFHRDHLGNTRLLTSSTKSVLDRYAYFPYGVQRSQSGAVTEAMRFTGHERDTNGAGSAGIQDYMHARYYSPHLARFSRVDPMRGAAGAPQSLNRYAYVSGNPLAFVDPRGLDAQCVVMVDGVCQVYAGGGDTYIVNGTALPPGNPLLQLLLEIEWYMNIFASGAGREDRIFAEIMDRLMRLRPAADAGFPNLPGQEDGDTDPEDPPDGTEDPPDGSEDPPGGEGPADGAQEPAAGNEPVDETGNEPPEEAGEDGGVWPEWSCSGWVTADVVLGFAIASTTGGMVGSCLGSEFAGSLGVAACVTEASSWSLQVGILAPLAVAGTVAACGD